MTEPSEKFRENLQISDNELDSEIALRKKSEDALRQSEEKFRTLFEFATDAIFILDLKGNFIDVNRTAYERLGYAKAEMLNMHISQLDPPEFAAKVPMRMELIKNHGVAVFETAHLRKDGTAMPVEVNTRILDYDGRQVFFSIVRDITERKRAEEALKKSEERYRTFIDAAADISTLKDDNFRFLIINKACEKYFDRKEEDIIGKTDFDLLPEGVAGNCRKTDIEALKSDNVITTEEVIGERIFETRKYRVRIGNDKFGIGAYIRDITEQKVAEEELKRHREQLMDLVKERTSELQRANERLVEEISERKQAEAEALRASQLAALGELSAGVAHEINNPINGIINYSQMLLNTCDPESKEYDLARRIIKESDRIANIVGNLLSFARKRDDEKAPVNVRKVIDDSVALTGAQLKRDGINLKVSMSPELPEINANFQQIQQVFLNIISNARYALNQRYQGTHENKVLEICAKEAFIDDHSYIQVTFKDRGTGIPAEILDKVINPFFTTKRSNMGTGLGLSISHGIISDHGGNLAINSVEGNFTEVIIRLPLK
jgi:PAS domain S-box-containing protein